MAFSRQGIMHNCMLAMMILKIMIMSGHSYNLEERLPLFKYGPKLATFGFSVAQHRITNKPTGAAGSLLVVGAPTARASAIQRGLSTPRKPGGVFYCPVSTSRTDCMQVEMDAGGDVINENTRTAFLKSNQWLGVSLKSQGPGKFLVSCAHRYTQQLYLNMGIREKERVCGKCFLLNANSSGIFEVDPKSESLSMEFISTPCDYYQNWLLNNKARYGYLQAGTSISLNSDGYLLGAPGAWRWTGGMFDISMPTYEAGDNPKNVFSWQQAPTPNVSATPTCNVGEWTNRHKCANVPINRDGYLGFSVATSSAVDAGSDTTYYAAGAPRGNNTGAVVLFRKSPGSRNVDLVPDPDNIVVGTGIGSSFGYSIAFCDVNGDGLDDLIVGSPQYYEYNNKRKAGGAVYVYINDGVAFRNIVPHVFYGPLDSFFGHAVANLGDIDQDGYGDFAIGSPYEDGHGVVHIYRGSADGKPKLSQAIKGSSYPFVRKDTSSALVGFGASLSGDVDSDSNRYPDLLIGSLSDHVALFRSRPIISVNMTFEVDRDELDLEERNCSSAGEDFSCFSIRYCFEYTARHGEYAEEVPLRCNLVLDSIRQAEGKQPRTNFNTSDGQNRIVADFTLPRSGVRICPGGFQKVFFANGVEDRLSSIGVDFDFDLNLPAVTREAEGDAIFQMINDPILDTDFEKKVKRIVKIKNTCGDDGCQSNLKVNAAMPDEIVVGDNATLALKIKIWNLGEEAHQAYVTASVPPDVDVPTLSENGSINCYPQDQSLVRCDIGNPYKEGAKNEIVIPLGISRLTSKVKKIEVKVNGFTSSENPEIPEIVLHARVWIEQDLTLTAFGQPQQVRYEEKKIIGESAMNETADIGPSVSYSFDIKNEASTEAQGVGLIIGLPTTIFNGKWLLYLVTSEVTKGGNTPAGSCNDKHVNNLQLEPSLALPGRIKREIKPEVSSRNRNLLLATLSCEQDAHCITVECSLYDIPPKASTSVILQMRLWQASFLEEKSLRRLDLVYINTTARLTTSQDNVRFKDGEVTETVQTTVDHDFFRDSIISTFPWWYILIAVILLLIIYILIIFLLVKCGFFKRKRYPRDVDNRQAVLEE